MEAASTEVLRLVLSVALDPEVSSARAASSLAVRSGNPIGMSLPFVPRKLTGKVTSNIKRNIFDAKFDAALAGDIYLSLQSVQRRSYREFFDADGNIR